MDIRSPTREHEALIEGQHAGRLSLAPGLNPYTLGTSEYSEWERGRASVDARRAAEVISQRARTAQCRYTVGSCGCGGRGLCLDVA